MAVTSLSAVFAAAAAIPDSVRATWAEVSDAITAGTATRADLQHLAAEIDGLLDDVRDVRDDLDSVDVEDHIRGVHPEQVVTGWRAERETRRQLVRMAGALLDLQTAVQRLIDGDQRAFYISRDGDTLQSIAAKLLGDWRSYTLILEANPDLSPGPLPSGTMVVIPERR